MEIGVWDWLRPDWLMAYYPSDLPVDWRPAYYANDYACVGLPASSWTPADLSRWSEETGETLVYWLGCGPGQLASQDLAGVLKALGRQLAGICFEAVEPAAARELMNVLRRTVPSAGYAADPPSPASGRPGAQSAPTGLPHWVFTDRCRATTCVSVAHFSNLLLPCQARWSAACWSMARPPSWMNAGRCV
ncbi:hypothetical protein BI364_14695 [Acidihalobacter yilgarnensis]|uniref:Uncharacterized protein n=1 Tax=Acidihalobacter yilgarnensis TaxID=2819280 RepID=A0A1D8IRJ5_9GAMM|nr:hypothetical protein BI364_14695 [Acidihalobacter yilgarnensis]